MAIALPKIGDWYQKAGGDLFEVVAIDERDGAIEIQYFDGTIEEVEADAWRELMCFPAVAPEDYSGSLDMTSEDYAAQIDMASGKRWGDPLDYLDQSE